MPISYSKLQIVKITIAAITLLLMSFFLFYNLGHYALWDDEATTALFGKTLWKTGDTSALDGHNIIAFEWGYELKNLKQRFMPPLQFYLAAPFVGLNPTSSFWARFPFAACGFSIILFIYFWLWKEKASTYIWVLLSLGFLGNVSFMLFSRQCRYYAPTMLASVSLCYFYTRKDKKPQTLIGLTLSALMLQSSNYICYGATILTLLADYFFWSRKNKTYRLKEAAAFFVPQILLGVLLFFTYNPLAKSSIIEAKKDYLVNSLTLFLWNLREVNSTEIGVGVLILLSIILYFFKKDPFLIRCPLAIFFYCLIVALISPQDITKISYAITRYLVCLIPLCIFVSAICIRSLTQSKQWLGITLAVIAFGTNFLNGGPFVKSGEVLFWNKKISKPHFRSTIYDFTKELLNPPPSAYGETAEWIKKNIEKGASVYVMPHFAVYPLMFHAPGPLYAWQIKTTTGQFKGLPDIHIYQKDLPSYIIVFGYEKYHFKTLRDFSWKYDVQYEKIHYFNIYWYDLIRPEMYLHTFKEITIDSILTEGIHIFRIKKE